MKEFLGHAWVEVETQNIAHNVREIRKLIGPSRPLMAVVKADGYGHGAVEVAWTALGAGASCLGVSTVAEALELRLAGFDAPVMVFGGVGPGEAHLAVSHDLTVSVFSREAAIALAEAAREVGRRVKVHLKLDTGMSRFGIAPAEALDMVRFLSSLGWLEVEGVYTQLAGAFRADKQYSEKQFRVFMNALVALAAEGYDIPVRHAASSAAILSMPETYLSMVRAGSLIYGISPSRGDDRLDLKPAWRLLTRVSQVRKLPRGVGVGYGPDYFTRRETVVATIPVGYADGLGLEPVRVAYRLPNLLRGLGGALLERLGIVPGARMSPLNGAVLIRGQPVRVLGRICMQQCMVDVTHLPDVREGEEVVIRSRKSITSPRLTRLYLSGGVPYKLRTVLGEFALEDEHLAARKEIAAMSN